MTIRERTQEHSHEFLVIQFLCFSCQEESNGRESDALVLAVVGWLNI
jgi:hypothetical protein